MQSVKSIGKIFVSVSWLVSLFAGSAFAQDCETYDLYGVVTSERGKPIKGALLDLLDDESKKSVKLDRWGKPLAKVTSGRDGSYRLSVISLPTNSAQDYRRRYVLRVTAPGFIAYEQRVDIELCGFKINIKLAKTKRSAGKDEKR